VNQIGGILSHAIAALNECGASFAIIGGLAVSVRTEPRFTRDIDIAVRVESDQEAESLIHGMLQKGYQTLMVIEQTATKRMAAVRLLPPHSIEDPPPVDLLFASSGIEAEIVETAQTDEILPGIVGAVAQIPHLIAMKVLAVNEQSRPHDASDLNALFKIADEPAIQTARELLQLISTRGFSRDKDLLADYEELMRKY